jgi:hypothetical protein
MEIDALRKYNHLYNASCKMGSSRILREYLGLNDIFPIPLSISHGVDFNHCFEAMDVRAIEPIHWSYNDVVHRRALTVKASLKLPHPWLLLRMGRTPLRGTGALVIGPPPGDSNDLGLLSCLNDHGINNYSILIKHKEGVSSSILFWQRNGTNVECAGREDDLFYNRLFCIMEKYECVISGTLSSALIFASAIGKKCRVLENYSCSGYDVANYLNKVTFRSKLAVRFLKLVVGKRDFEASRLAEEVLGMALVKPHDELRRDLLSCIEHIGEPFHFGSSVGKLERRIICMLSVFAVPTGLISYGLLGGLKRRLIDSKRVSEITMNEIDIWLNGINKSNFHCQEVRYVKGVTIPGNAIKGLSR